MKILSVNGHGKCIECGKETSTQMWIGRMQLFFCETCVNKLSVESTSFMNDYKIKIMHMMSKSK